MVRQLAATTLIIFSYQALSAHSAADTAAQSFCSSNYSRTGSCLEKIPSSLQTAMLMCESIKQSSFCKEVEKNEPQLTGNFRQCSLQDLCLETVMPGEETLETCKDGYLLGAGEQFVETYEFFMSWADGVATRVEEKNKAIELCDESIECKRSLAAEIPRLKNLSDEALNKYSAAALVVELQNFSYVVDSYKRTSLTRKSLADQAARSEVNQPFKEHQRVQSRSLFLAVQAWLERKQARLQCLNKKTRIQMICWGAAYIASPSSLAGAATKAVPAAKYVLSVAASTRNVAEEVIRKSIHEIRNLSAIAPELSDLKQAIAANNEGYHRLVVRRGKGYLDIGFLKAHEIELSKAMTRAIKGGHIAEIDAGNIIGPKVLGLIKRSSEMVPAGKSMKIRGSLNVERLYREAKAQQIGQKMLDKDGKRNPRFWSNSERNAFESVFVDLKIVKACKDHFGTEDLNKCGPMSFEFDAAHPDRITWLKAK